MKVNKKQTLAERIESWPRWARAITGSIAFICAFIILFSAMVILIKILFKFACLIWAVIP